ncbi:hypothetical protein [Marinoscillum pacificum]|uniref:hypothetical protein n=1 Tax=Marinoscillum pacificum TaxID=392723 RepID=UPI0021575BB2|nr:hypothetical protein [Marinoscillum pacificum]
MIIKLLFKNWKLILDIVIVLAIIVLIFLWNPKNIFGNGLELHDTANMVAEIKEIGELITAEYYGEVIASDEEATLGILDIDSVELEGINLYNGTVKKIILTQYVEESALVYEKASEKKFLFESGKNRYLNNQLSLVKSKVVDTVYKELDDALKDDDMSALLLFIANYEHGTGINQKKFIRKDKKNRTAYVRNVLKSIIETEYDRVVKYADGDPDYQNYLQQGFTTNHRYTDFYFDFMDKGLSRKEQKVEIAVIGRGSVKAGFKFDKLDERNVVYDSEKQVIHLFGFNAEVLYQDINPWFIPEQSVPGYQIVMAENASFEKMKELKMHCIDKLRYNAEVAGIIQQAQDNGEEAIAEFFGLLLGTDIKKVVFRNDLLAIEAKYLIEDSVITHSELILIDSLINKEIVKIDQETGAVKERRQLLLQSFISGLSKYPISWRDQEFSFNYFNRHIPSLMKDSIILFVTGNRQDLFNNEYQVIQDLKGSFFNNQFKFPDDYQFWSDDSLQYFTEYNQFVSLLSRSSKIKKYQEDSTMKFDANVNYNLVSKNGLDTLNYLFVGDTIYLYHLDPYTDLALMKYTMKDSADLTNEFMLKNIDESFIKSQLNSLGIVSADSLFNYLVNAKIQFNARDNGFKRFRRKMDGKSEFSESMNSAKKGMDNFAQWAKSLMAN